MSGEQRAVGVARRLVMQLLGHHVTEAVLAPGSRSGPLALALHAADAQRLIRLHVRVDEREAAFLALGLAKASRAPVPVVTTSGTAVANLHPAMLEASHAGVRLVAITADRPGALRGTGANQTTDQREIFPGVAYADRVNDLWIPADGPLHLNLELDEPLIEPVEWDFPQTMSAGSAREPGQLTTLEPGPRTVVIAGDEAGRRARILARDAGWPLIAEPSSGSRTGDALVAGRLLLGHAPLADRIERVVSLGHATLSRPVTRLLARDDVDVIHVGDQATFPVQAGPRVTFVDEVAVTGADDPAWMAEWRSADRAATAAVDAQLDGTTGFDVARAVHAAVPPGGLLFVGSSSPIRDLDLVAPPYPVGEKRRVLANRGLAGIDGTVSTAIGAALARPGARSIALVGDLTFLHGSNGLLIGPGEARPDLTIVVVNDDGGSIFATLEQGAPEYAGAFERVYGTPTGADLAALCRGYGVAHRAVAPADLGAALTQVPRGIEVLEVAVDRSRRRALTERIAAAVRDVLG